ncbi:MAG TPA: alpha/beta fold hydrolase [Solirubrobacteraceae bacterium]|nr:alpha/beta fold hydrolase [Solirubrobacteraceae bacterium]
MSASINHHREGSGDPIVLLHGIGHHWQAWGPVVGLLAGELDVLACDSPGFGASAPLARGIEPTVPAYADAFEWFFAELGLRRPHVAGNSMGGAIALELARRRSVRSATAFSPAGFWTAAEARFCRLSLLALADTPVRARPAVEALARTRSGRSVLFRQTFGFPARLPAEEAVATLRDAWASPAFDRALELLPEYRCEAIADLRDVPVTVAWGTRDLLLPYRTQAPRARKLLPTATHLALGAGHVPFYDDAPAAAAAIRATVAVARAEAGAAQTPSG